MRARPLVLVLLLAILLIALYGEQIARPSREKLPGGGVRWRVGVLASTALVAQYLAIGSLLGLAAVFAGGDPQVPATQVPLAWVLAAAAVLIAVGGAALTVLTERNYRVDFRPGRIDYRTAFGRSGSIDPRDITAIVPRRAGFGGPARGGAQLNATDPDGRSHRIPVARRIPLDALVPDVPAERWSVPRPQRVR